MPSQTAKNRSPKGEMNKKGKAGMDAVTKDRFDVASKLVAIIGGLLSAAILIISLQAYMKQLHHYDALKFIDRFGQVEGKDPSRGD
jgi:hypothetical protein